MLRRFRDLIAQILLAHHLDPFGQDRAIEIPCVGVIRIELQLRALQFGVKLQF